MGFKNNCYGFVQSALEGNSEENKFCNISDIDLGEKIISGKVLDNIEHREKIKEDILSLFDDKNEKYLILELGQSEYSKDSQHIAILHADLNFSDQNGPDGPIRINKNIEILLDQYGDIFGCNYYNIYSLKNKTQQDNIDKFLADFI